MIPAHPYAPFSHRASLTALAMALLALLLWRVWPVAFNADLVGLLAGYASVVGLLEPARRWQHGAVLAGWTTAAIAGSAALGGWLAGLLHVQLPTAGRWHANIAAYVAAALCVLILPGLVRRWLAWREARLLAAQAAQYAADRTLLEARLAALQGQIEPHFLYNTLANVQYLLRRDGERADQMLERLIAYLRAAMPELRQSETSLGQELARVQAYLDIMAIRMGERLRYQIDCPADLAQALLPPLSIATLVENALKHGLEAKPGNGCIHIVVQTDEASLQVAVCDDGLGFSETGNGSGVGLRNLRERLAVQYGDAAGLELEAQADGGVRAAFHLPLRSATPAEVVPTASERHSAA